MKTINIIQARMGSSRFPNKMMADLHGEPVINWVLKRCLQAQSVDKTILATSRLSGDDILAKQAEQLGVAVFRGDEADVLSRYADITKAETADLVVRVCGDRPLIDPSLIDQAVAFMHANSYANAHIDLAYNHISGQGQNWPRGFGVEIIKAEHIIHMNSIVDTQFHREHVTPYIWELPEKYNITALTCHPNLDIGIVDIECDLDTEEDLAVIKNISENIGIHGTAEQFFSNWLSLYRPTLKEDI